MIRQAMRGAILALGLMWVAPTDSDAGTINVTVREPILSGTYTADVAGTEIFALGELTGFVPLAITSEQELWFSGYVEPGADFGDFDITTPAFDSFLTGSLIAFEFDVGVPKLRLLYAVLGGSAAPDFGARFLVEMIGLPAIDGTFLHQGEITVSAVAAIPLPATLPLLLMGLSVSFGLVRVRRRSGTIA